MDLVARGEDQVPWNGQGIDTHQCRARRAVVEHGGAYLAGIVKLCVIGLAVAARFLAANVRSDIALGEAGFEGGRGAATRRLERGAGPHGGAREQELSAVQHGWEGITTNSQL